MTAVALVSDLVQDARTQRRARLGAHAALAARDNYWAAFHRLNDLAKLNRDAGWDEGADELQRLAERAYRAAKAEYEGIAPESGSTGK